jgi:hypothetical protein
MNYNITSRVPQVDVSQTQLAKISNVNAFTSWIKTPINQIALYVHKKLGTHILVAQKNPHKFTIEEGKKGCQNLTNIGGKFVSFKTSDNILINGMHFIGKDCTESSPTIILFNGNGLRYEEYGSQTFSGIRLFTIKNWLKLGVNVLVFNYRGIESDQGSATRDGLILDGDAAFRYVHEHLKVPENKIIFHGHSLGSGIASEVACRHPKVNFCSDRSFSSLSQQVKMMFGGGVFGRAMSSLVKYVGWEFSTFQNLEKIKGYKWIIYHPCDKVIPLGARLVDALSATNDKIAVIVMSAQQFQTKKGLRSEDLSQRRSATPGEISYAGCSTHMRKLHGVDEKASYEKQIRLAVTV